VTTYEYKAIHRPNVSKLYLDKKGLNNLLDSRGSYTVRFMILAYTHAIQDDRFSTTWFHVFRNVRFHAFVTRYEFFSQLVTLLLTIHNLQV
jgi:hypothetical protein